MPTYGLQYRPPTNLVKNRSNVDYPLHSASSNFTIKYHRESETKFENISWNESVA
jgi:hypothetical protein